MKDDFEITVADTQRTLWIQHKQGKVHCDKMEFFCELLIREVIKSSGKGNVSTLQFVM